MNDQERECYERAVQAYNRTKDFKESLTGRNKKLMEQIDQVRIDTHRHMNIKEVDLFYEMFNNSLIDGCYTIYRLGYMRGQRAIENSKKKEAAIKKSAMSETLQKLDEVKVPDAYGITFDQAKAIISKNNSSIHDCIADAVRFGYLAAKRELEQEVGQ